MCIRDSFIVVLSILALYTLFLTDFSLLGEQKMLRAYFPQANGLRQGDAVQVAGMRVGRVKSLTYHPESPPNARIIVVMVLDRDLTLYEDFEIRIEESTFLGGRQINVWPGQGAMPEITYSPDEPLKGTVIENPLSALRGVADLFERNEGRVENILSGLEDMVKSANEGPGLVATLLNDRTLAEEAARAVTGAADTFEDAAEITERLRTGQGTAGRLLSEDQMYETALAILDDVKTVTGEVKEGRGSVGRIVMGDALADELETAATNIREITDQVRSGQGTVGRFVYDDAIAQNVEQFTRTLNDADGTVGALIHSREMYDRWIGISDDIGAVARAIREGEGSLGKVIMEPDLYDEVLLSVRLLNRSLEDYREAAPISTFTSVLFGAF